MIESPEALFRDHRSLLLLVARGILHSEEDAEDCLQSAMVQIVRAWDQCDPEKARQWACAVVKNQALDVLRKRRSRRFDFHVSLDDVTPPTVPSEEKPIIARLTIARIFGCLSKKQRILMLSWMAGERDPRVTSTLRGQRRRALLRLRERMLRERRAVC
jgi:RNA polymerase sigma factor (sigma-70 family)